MEDLSKSKIGDALQFREPSAFRPPWEFLLGQIRGPAYKVYAVRVTSPTLSRLEYPAKCPKTHRHSVPKLLMMIDSVHELPVVR